MSVDASGAPVAPVQVPNPYRAALGQALASAEGTAETLRGLLAPAVRAMTGGAWVSSVADAFAAELAGNRATLGSSGDACVADLRSARDAQPVTVEAGAWQTRWRNLR